MHAIVRSVRGCVRLPRSRAARVSVAVLAAGVVAVPSALALQSKPAASSSPYAGVAQFVYGTNYARWLGKKATGSPIYLGWTNTEGGPLGGPWYTRLADASVSMINNELGGIAGHKLVLKKCLMPGGAEAGTQCAQQLANDDSLTAVMTSWINGPEGATFYNTFPTTKPVFGWYPLSTYDGARANTYIFNPGSLGVGAIWYAFKLSKIKTAAIVVTNDAASTRQVVAGPGGFVDQAKAKGVALTPVFIPQSATDYTATIAASNLNRYDAVLSIGSTTAATITLMKTYKALSVNAPLMMFNSAGLSPDIKRALGDWPKYTYYSDYTPPTIKATGRELQYIQAYTAALKKWDNTPGDFGQYRAPLAFFLPVIVTRILASIGANHLSPTRIAQAAANYHGGSPLGAPFSVFGKKPFPAVGFIGFRFFKYVGKGTFQPLYGGKWLTGTGVVNPFHKK